MGSRTARSRTSGEKFLGRPMTPSSQHSESPANPARSEFSLLIGCDSCQRAKVSFFAIGANSRVAATVGRILSRRLQHLGVDGEPVGLFDSKTSDQPLLRSFRS